MKMNPVENQRRLSQIAAGWYRHRPVQMIVWTAGAIALIVGLVVVNDKAWGATNEHQDLYQQISLSTEADETDLDAQLVNKSCPIDDPCKPPPWPKPAPGTTRQKYDRGLIGNSNNMVVPLRVRELMRDAFRRAVTAKCGGGSPCPPCNLWFCPGGSSTPPVNSCVATPSGACVKGDPNNAIHIPWSDVSRVALTCLESGAVGAAWAMKGTSEAPLIGQIPFSYVGAAGAGFQGGVEACAFTTSYHHFFDWPF